MSHGFQTLSGLAQLSLQTAAEAFPGLQTRARPGQEPKETRATPSSSRDGPQTDSAFPTGMWYNGIGVEVGQTGRLRLRLDRKEDTMVSPILVPLDGSRLAEQALPCAVMLGKGLSAELVLLRAVSMETDADQALKEIGLDAEGIAASLARPA